MKKYFITKSKGIYNFYIFTDRLVPKKNTNQHKKDVEISYELLLDNKTRK